MKITNCQIVDLKELVEEVGCDWKNFGLVLCIENSDYCRFDISDAAVAEQQRDIEAYEKLGMPLFAKGHQSVLDAMLYLRSNYELGDYVIIYITPELYM